MSDQTCAIARVVADAAQWHNTRGLTPPAPRSKPEPYSILTAPITTGHERLALAAALGSTPVERLWDLSEELLRRIRRRANARRPVQCVTTSFDEMCERLGLIQAEIRRRGDGT